MHTRVSVVTPSLNMLSYLKRCVSSVADQEGVSFEHIVVDGHSSDGTRDWLGSGINVRSISEPDEGMYDAVNKGLRIAEGEILAFLNCDEQYLPGTLAFVDRLFWENPGLDVLFGDFLVVRSDGSLIAYRKSCPPRRPYLLSSHLYLFTCTMFFRRAIVDAGIFFDPGYKYVADLDFVLKLLDRRYRVQYVNRYFSTFTMTGGNLSMLGAALNEKRLLFATRPLWQRSLKWPLNAMRLAEKAIRGAYHERSPLQYSMYRGEADKGRTTFSVSHPTFFWQPLK